MESEDADVLLEATDLDYMDIINDGPYIPKRIVGAGIVEEKEVPEHYLVKEKSDWTKEDKIEVLKDAKVRNILHNSLDPVMSNRVIACKTAKEIWDTLKIQCSGTKAVKRTEKLF